MNIDQHHLRIADYNYDLPDHRIAKFPLSQRDASKLLVYRQGQIVEDTFASLPRYLTGGALMVFNNTRVIQARLHFRKDTGALIEVFCMEPHQPREYQQNFTTCGQVEWLCMIGNLKRWKNGILQRSVEVGGHPVRLTAERLPFDVDAADGTQHRVRFTWDDSSLTFSEILQAVGELPIPPYLNRATEESDLQTYQTVYSKIQGSVAAPTAGLHFTAPVLQALDAAGIERDELTLHVGAGTFKPVKTEEIGDHEMHSEYIVVRRHTIERLLDHKGHCIAVGTTSVRTLESLYYIGRKMQHHPEATEEQLCVAQWEPYEDNPAASSVDDQRLTLRYLQNILDWFDRNKTTVLHTATQIIITPGYHFHIVRALVTNFHQPQSTLLLLVSAFVQGRWRDIYDYALSHDFRFLSYGDSSLLIP